MRKNSDLNSHCIIIIIMQVIFYINLPKRMRTPLGSCFIELISSGASPLGHKFVVDYLQQHAKS